MFKIISQLSFKNAFKHKPDTTVNYNLSFLCLWLKNKDIFLYIDNTVDCKIKPESKNASYQNPKEDSMLSDDDATKISEDSKIEEYLCSLCDSNSDCDNIPPIKPKYKKMRGKIKRGFGNFPTNNKKFLKKTSKLFRKEN